MSRIRGLGIRGVSCTGKEIGGTSDAKEVNPIEVKIARLATNVEMIFTIFSFLMIITSPFYAFIIHF